MVGEVDDDDFEDNDDVILMEEEDSEEIEIEEENEAQYAPMNQSDDSGGKINKTEIGGENIPIQKMEMKQTCKGKTPYCFVQLPHRQRLQDFMIEK